MNQNSPNFLPLLISVLFLVGALVFVFSFRHRRKTSMRTLATRLGLSVVENEPYFPNIPLLKLLTREIYANGLLDGRTALVRNFSVGRATFTGVDVRLSQGTLLLSVTRRSFLARLNYSSSTQKFASGDAALDERFLFRSNAPAIACAVVTEPAIREAILAAQRSGGLHGSIEVRGALLHYQESGCLTGNKRIARIEAVTRLMTRLAPGLDAAAPLLSAPRN